MKNFSNWPWTTIVKVLVISLSGIVLLLLVFSAGMSYGFRKAQFSFQWGDNYHRMFGGPQRGWLEPRGPMMRGDDFINPNGAAGTVIKTDTTTITMKGVDNVEKSVFIGPNTAIRRGRDNIQLSDLKSDDRIVVLGVPSSTGQIEAHLVRVFDR